MELPMCGVCKSTKPNSYIVICSECASKAKELQTTDRQQLKAEILLLIQRVKQCAYAGDMDSVKGLLEQVDAKLSAV